MKLFLQPLNPFVAIVAVYFRTFPPLITTLNYICTHLCNTNLLIICLLDVFSQIFIYMNFLLFIFLWMYMCKGKIEKDKQRVNFYFCLEYFWRHFYSFHQYFEYYSRYRNGTLLLSTQQLNKHMNCFYCHNCNVVMRIHI